jgi:pimeloyl-ACP methyl ester carboxylesterase
MMSLQVRRPPCIPNARLHVVRGGGHLFLLEHPARMAAMVADYLKGDVGDDLEARPPN